MARTQSVRRQAGEATDAARPKDAEARPKDAKARQKDGTARSKDNARSNTRRPPPAEPEGFDGLDKRTLLEALTAFGKGDFSARLPEGLDGIDGRIAEAFNDVIGKTGDLTEDLDRLSGSIEQAGELSARLSLNGYRGNWARMVTSVNQVVGDLTQPIRETSRVIGAVARGDLTQTMELDIDGRPLTGEFLVTAKTVNSMVARLDSFAAEVTRVSREVGTDGALGGQARVAGVSGTWKDLTDSVNSMASNLTDQLRNIAEVTTAVANGDLSKKITVDVRGEMLELKNTVNTMVDQLNSFASEVTRVAREVGTEGKLGGQANVKGVAGTWKDLTENVNSMASNLTDQVRNIATVTTAVAKGDLSKKITVDAQGEILELKDTVNTMVDQLSSFADEVTRVAREVGTEGQLGGQADVKGVAGTWKDLTDNVNLMASNLTVQLRDVSKVATAIAEGDLTQKITVEVSGEILQIKNVINIMVDQLSSFADEVTRVAREVGTEGQLGGQANVEGVAGTWKDLTDSVNSMAGNLTDQVRNIATVVSAVASGDLSNKITVHVRGEMLELKQNINNLLDQLNSFASEVTRVAREVGTEGKLGGQASVPGVAGTWKDLTDNVNSMASNLTAQVRNIAAVTTAVANGDLSKKITVDALGEILELKSTVNTMVDQLSSFADEVTRVAREVGTEGKLGGQANVKGVAGTWRDLTESVNSMAGNLTDQVRNIAAVTTAVANGDLSKKITVDVRGEMLEMKDTINTMVDQLRSFAAEVTRVAREVGTEGKLGGQASVPGVAGTWKDLTDNVNSMARNLTGQVRNIAAVTTAVANGDLSKHITVDVHGEMLEMKDTLNTMVDQLNRFASEVTRVAREVGSEGKLGGQADVKGVAGTWKDLTDNVNSMAGNLTNQVRGIARVVTGVANGNLKRKLAVDAQGEIAELADTINGMIDTLAIFADQVTTVAREVGVEGKLGGQASVPGAAGIWKNLTDNVNQLADNLTTQVRAIADVATAVTSGDLTRSIQVDAQGEVAALKDNINEMIRNLKDTTRENADQDWLKTNLAKFSRMLQGQRDLETVGALILRELATVVEAQQGSFYVIREEEERPTLGFLAGYACDPTDRDFQLGDGLIGECARENRKIELDQVPPGYLQVRSSLGEATAASVVILPIAVENHVKAVMELAGLSRFSPIHHTFLDQLCESIGIVLNTIEANTRTEGLLKQSQSLASELQSQQQELQQTNAELEDKARLLEDRNVEVERKNWEVEQARRALEEKAEQLALTSKYKSEFLANMSHELRTPLNTLLILSDELRRNPAGNLTQQQVKCAQAILASANDLLNSINDILDLSKIESGTVVIEVVEVNMQDVREYVERTFRHMAEAQHLQFVIDVRDGLPEQIRTDVKRLQQVLKNLLSNAFKFTERGRVSLMVECVESGWSRDNTALNRAAQVIAFTVQDTGIGIPSSKQQVIFEAFQQADGSTSRRYGGTGLGLAISREIAQLLGGEIKLDSEPGQGSAFCLYVPQPCTPVNADLPDASVVYAPPVQDALPSPADPGSGSTVEPAPPAERTLLLVGPAFKPGPKLVDLAAQSGWGIISRSTGATAMSALRERPPGAIALDVNIVDIDGWNFLAALKQDIELRHLPVLVTGAGDELPRALRLGAAGALPDLDDGESLLAMLAGLERWRDPSAQTVCVIGANAEIAGVLERLGIEDRVAVYTEATALLTAVTERTPDLLIIGETLEEAARDRLRDWFGRQPDGVAFPILVTHDPEADDLAGWEPFLESQPVSMVGEPELLLDRVSLLLHMPVADLSTREQEVLRRLSDPSEVLASRRALIVDDDIRNIFAMTSVLERYGMHVLTAETGSDAIELLENAADVEMVLMDIMMPEMDGYETIREIRSRPRFRSLPIVAVTAKAMVGDRQKCREAGASDYIPKPVDTDQLVRVMAGWLRQRAI